MARLTGEALLAEMLASKQTALARKEAAGEDISWADPTAIVSGGVPVYGAGAWPTITPEQALEQVAIGGAMNGQPEVAQAGLGGLLAAGAGALGVTMPAWLTALMAGGAAVVGGAQALGFGEGEGLFGLDILGGDEQYMNGIPFGGPGLAEPPAEWVEKEWHVRYDWGSLQYYLVRMPSGIKKIALYNTRTKKWKIWTWRAPRLAVIGKNMPSHKMITRLRRNLSKHSADAKTILKMTSPQYVAQQYNRARRRR